MYNKYISIGLPFYNNEKTLSLAIESVLAQTVTNWDLFLFNDGSSDSSLRIARLYSSKYDNIHLFNDEKNKGFVYRLNQFIDFAESEFLVRMDADDIMLPTRLEVQIGYLLRDINLDIVSSGAYIINQKNEIQGIRNCTYLNSYKFSDLFSKSYIIHPTVVFRKSWINKNKYDEKFVRAEDLELWCRTFLSHNHYRIPSPLLCYREGSINIRNYVLSMNTNKKIIKLYSIGHLSLPMYYWKIILIQLKISSYIVFGFFNLQHLLTRFRSLSFDLKNIDEVSNYLNIMERRSKEFKIRH
jgi:glycosyltransferase involved in cell wall biosynthesis